jgi:micrococcal nuclease
MSRRRKKRLSKPLQLALLVLILTAFYFLYYQPRQKPKPEPSISGLQAVEIVDGDTFRDSEGESIRLLGIDTPEKGDTFCNEATHSLDSLLKGHVLRYEFDSRKRDRYGRLLAYVFTEDAFVNRELVRMGLAEVYIFPDDMKNLDYRSLLIEDQMLARGDSLGIWSLPVFEKENYYVGNTDTYRFHRPTCFSAKGLNPEHKIIKESRDEFLDLGYSPCRNCNP